MEKGEKEIKIEEKSDENRGRKIQASEERIGEEVTENKVQEYTG